MLSILIVFGAAVAGALITVVGIRAIGKFGSTSNQRLTAAFIGVLLGLTPLCVEWFLATRFNERLFLFELPAYLLLIPSASAVLVAWSARTQSPAADIALLIWAWCGFEGAINTANLCAPGYCGSYGFPIPFYSWSDAVMVFDGEAFPDPFRPAALVLDILVFLAIPVVLVKLSKQDAVQRIA